MLWTGGTMAFVVLVGAGVGYVYLKHLEGNVTTTDIGSAGKSSFSKDEAFNILLLGTDKRTGAGNEGYGDKGSSGHADTTILLHVSKDRTNATALSIPRDLIGDIPDCPTKQADGSTKVIPGLTHVRFNRSLGESGRDPGCTMRTIKENTGITVDHFMMADFNAVKTLTSAVGGVPVVWNTRWTTRTPSSSCPRASPRSRARKPWRLSAPGTVGATRATWTASRCSSSSWPR
ncbi:Polyisoprenyl-teichoic acid--peptidoglycan teichoic acid transferase TagU [Streptomyces fumanus]